MTRHATPAQLADTIRRTQHALAQLASYLPALTRWEAEADRGYPTQGDGPTGKGDHSDPTYRAHLDNTTISTQIAAWFTNVDRACQAVLQADGQGASLMPIDHGDWLKKERDAKGQGCVNCHTHGIWSAIHKAGRCTPCYSYRLRHDGIDAPTDIIEAREHVRKQRSA